MKRLQCVFGRHWYKPGAASLELLAEDGKAWAFKVTDRCVYCGAENVIYIKIPKPTWLAKEENHEQT